MDNLISIESPSQPILNNKSESQTTPTENNKILNHVNHTYNNNIKAASPQIQNCRTTTGTDANSKLKTGDISLDPSNLLSETKKTYANIQANKDFRTPNGPYSIDSNILNHKPKRTPEILSNDTEISC